MAKDKNKSYIMAGNMVRGLLHLIIIAATIVTTVFLVRYAVLTGYRVFGSNSRDKVGSDITVVYNIKAGDDIKYVSEELEKQGIIIDAFSFRLKADLLKTRLKAGSYSLRSSMSYDEILDIISDR